MLVLAAALTRMRPAWALMRRARWLFLLMILAYAWSLPGEAILPVAGDISPTREGLYAGLLQAWRLAVLLLLLDALVLRLPANELLSGVHAVLRPFARLGLDPHRTALRLALTLQAMQRPPGWQGLRALLRGELPGDGMAGCYALTVRSFRTIDWTVLLGLLLAGPWLIA